MRSDGFGDLLVAERLEALDDAHEVELDGFVHLDEALLAAFAGGWSSMPGSCSRSRWAGGWGSSRFVDELLARVRRAGAAGQILLRADSGFWDNKVTARLRRAGLPLLDRRHEPAPRRRADRPAP